MAKVITDVILKDGVDETEFINDVTSNAEVDLKDRVENISNMVVLNVEKSYIPTLNNHASVKEAQAEPIPEPPVTYPDKPPICSILSFLLIFEEIISCAICKFFK